MFGLDDWIASFSDGATLAVVAVVAVVLGLRHASDPDHLAAVTTLMAGARERAAGAAAWLGLSWGLGHALSLFAFGLPIVLFKAYLPEPVQRGAETSVGVLIAGLAVWLLVRWRRGLFHVHVHSHERGLHAHGHVHDGSPHAHGNRPARTPLQALGIGLVHGMGGSAGVGILLVASIESQALSIVALALLAIFTAVSMTMLSTGFGAALGSGPLRSSFAAIAPAFGLASLGFAVWYGAAAWALAPYPF